MLLVNNQERMCKTKEIISDNDNTIFTKSFDIIKCQSGIGMGNKF